MQFIEAFFHSSAYAWYQVAYFKSNSIDQQHLIVGIRYH